MSENDELPEASISSADELLHHHTDLPRTRVSNILDGFIITLGKAAS